MQRSIAHRVAAVVAGALLGLGVAAASASGFTNNYCGVLISSGAWCGDLSNHSYDYNKASYTGGGLVWVCQRLVIADTSTERGSSCAYTYTEYFYAPYPYLTEASVTHYSGAARHTIYGLAIA
jgi:hypothetical protein